MCMSVCVCMRVRVSGCLLVAYICVSVRVCVRTGLLFGNTIKFTRLLIFTRLCPTLERGSGNMSDEQQQQQQ